MIEALRRAWANFRGFDLTGSTVPPMDGPLRPNALLDAAPILLRLDDVDNLTRADDRLVCSVENEILTLAMDRVGEAGLSVSERRDLGARVTSIASISHTLAIAVEGKGIVIEQPGERSRHLDVKGVPLNCITAMAFLDPAKLIVAAGSAVNSAADWKRDLMTKGASGSVWQVDLADGVATQLADGLAFPSGLAAAGGAIYVSEAWRHRVLALRAEGGRFEPVLSGLPAYPGRIAPSGVGGYWLAMFAPRNPLVEFVLKEEDYRTRMVATIDPDFWIAPSLRAGRSFLEPIQGGARKKLNMLKPWSPTWSTGLIVRCDADMRMMRSYHSRADGDVHGIMSACAWGGQLLAGAKGSGKVVAIEDVAEHAET